MRSLVVTSVMAGALAAASCGGGSQPATAPASAPVSPPAEGQATGPQWPNASTVNAAARSALPADVSDKLQEAPVPVLVPSDPRILAAARQPTVQPDEYTFTSNTEGLTVSVQAAVDDAKPRGASRIAPLPRRRVGSRDVFLTENEGIRVATWKENGVAYAAEIECASAEDARCRDDSYLLSMIERLAYVGGKGVRVQ